MKNLSLKNYLFEYEKNGWVKLKNLIDQNLIDNCQDTILNLFKKYNKDGFINQNSSLINNNELHKKIIKLREDDKNTFSKIYDILQTTICLKKLATSTSLIEVACDILKTNKSSLMLRNTLIRLDVPNDKRNTLDWHYDAYSLNDDNHIPEGGITMVIPFTEFTFENGCPELCIGSHKEPPIQRIKKDDKNYSETFSITNIYTDKFEKTYLTANPTDLIVFPMSTVHRSGKNISNKVRVCGLIRYYSFLDKTFEPLRESYSHIV